MTVKILLAALALVLPAAAIAQSSNTSSNSSSNNGVVRERTVDTYCDGDYCDRTVERRVYHDGSNRDERDGRWDRSGRGGWRGDGSQRFTSWALRNFDWNRDGRLNRREYDRALHAYRSN